MEADVFMREDGILRQVEITDQEKPEIPDGFINKWQEIIDLIAKIIDVPSALIMEITEEEMQVFLKSDNKENPYKKGAGDSLGHGLYCETVIGSNKELVVDNALMSECWKDNPDVNLNMISYYGLPIKWPDNEFFGTICILDNITNNYKEIYRELLSKFKAAFEDDLKILIYEQKLKDFYDQSKIKSILELAERDNLLDDESEDTIIAKPYDSKHSINNLFPFISKLDDIIYNDKLTGIHNRRYFINEVSKLETEELLPISIVIGDLDNLKSINDQYGHNIGDYYIKNAADILQNNFRTHDILARIGGDEFAVILPETNKEEVQDICKRIKEKFGEKNNKLKFKCEFSISLGIATLYNSQESLEDVYKRADRKMYKEKGKEIEEC